MGTTIRQALLCGLCLLLPGGLAMPVALDGTVGDASKETAAAVERFGAAVNAGDLDALAATMTDDCVFENTAPAPDGTRYEGKAAVLAFWERWLRNNPGASFETEEAFPAGDRYVVRWVYRKMRDGKPWHLRGVDVFRVRDGRVSEKLSYVKG